MKHPKKFHVVYSLIVIRKMLIVCLVPLVHPLLALDLASLYAALLQELALVLTLVVISWTVWLCSGWQYGPQGLTLRTGILFQRVRTLTPAQIAVIELRRSIPMRLVGATHVTVYLAKGASLPKASFYLPKREASRLAEELMPAQAATSFFRPTGAQRLSLVMLSANLMTTAALAWISLRQTDKTLGELLPTDWQALNEVTRQNLTVLERLVERFLPAGIAWLFTAVLVLSCLSLLLGLLRTAGFSVARHGGVILYSGGLLTLTQRRIRASAVTVCDVRTTLAARLLRRYPVYLAAGSYNGSDIPVLVYKRGQEQLLEALMPEFRISQPCMRRPHTQGRSLPAFIGVPGSCLLAFWVLFCVSGWQLPAMAPMLFLLVVVFLTLTLVQAQGFFFEDAWRAGSGVLTVQYVRGFTLHCACVFTPDLSFGTWQTPFSEARGRCTLRLRMPFHRLARVRSMLQVRANALALEV